MTTPGLRAEHGATAVEYALLVVLVAAVIAAVVTTLGLSVLDLFSSPTLQDAFS